MQSIGLTCGQGFLKCEGTGLSLSIWAFKSKLSMLWGKAAESSQDRESSPPPPPPAVS